MSNDDEVIDLNEGCETVANEFAIDIESTDVNSKKRKLSQTLESEQDASELEHVRKSPKNNLDLANAWFDSFFNAPEDPEKTDGNASKQANQTANNTNNATSKNNSNANNTNTPAVESPLISTKHLATSSPTNTVSNAATVNNIAPSTSTVPPSLAKVAVQPLVLPPNVVLPNIAIPVLKTLGERGTPKQGYRFSITQTAIVAPSPVAPSVLPSSSSAPSSNSAPSSSYGPTTAPAKNNQQTAVNNGRPLLIHSATNTPATTPKGDITSETAVLQFRLQDTATALAVVQKALEERTGKAQLVTAVPKLGSVPQEHVSVQQPQRPTLSTVPPEPPKIVLPAELSQSARAPRPGVVTVQNFTPPVVPSSASTVHVGRSAQNTVGSSGAKTNIRTSADGSRQALGVTPLRSSTPASTAVRLSQPSPSTQTPTTVRIPMQPGDFTSAPSVQARPQLSSSMQRAPALLPRAISPHPQVAASQPGPSYVGPASRALSPSASQPDPVSRTISPPVRTIAPQSPSPTQFEQIPPQHVVPVFSYQQHLPPRGIYHDYQSAYHRLVRSDHEAAQVRAANSLWNNRSNQQAYPAQPATAAHQPTAYAPYYNAVSPYQESQRYPLGYPQQQTGLNQPTVNPSQYAPSQQYLVASSGQHINQPIDVECSVTYSHMQTNAASYQQYNTTQQEPAGVELTIVDPPTANESDVIITGTNRPSEKPLRRSVALPPRRLVPSSTHSSSSTDSSNSNNTNVSTVTSVPSTTTPSLSTTAVAEPMEIEKGPLPQPNQPHGESSRVSLPSSTELPVSLPPSPGTDTALSSAPVSNDGERNPCMMLRTARFLQPRLATEANKANNDDSNTGQQNNIQVPAADQSELSRLRTDPPRRQIERSDEYGYYWSMASQSQVSQSASQEHEGSVQSRAQEEEKSDRSASTNALAKSSEFSLSNFEIDVPPAQGPPQPVPPNPSGFPNNNNNNSTSPPRLVGPLDKYFRTSPDKVPSSRTGAVLQDTNALQGHNEADAILIQDSQEDPSARVHNTSDNSVNAHNISDSNVNAHNISDSNVNAHNVNNNVNLQWHNTTTIDAQNTSDNNVSAHNTSNNNATTQWHNTPLAAPNSNASAANKAHVGGRKSPDSLRHSHDADKPKNEPVTGHRRVLLPYFPGRPLVLTRIEPEPYWHGGLLWPGLGTIKQQYMELFIPNDPRLVSIPFMQELPKLLMAREMVICDQQTMPNGHYCIQLISPVLDKHALPKAFWDPNYKAFWALKMHFNNMLLCIGPKMIGGKSILCLHVTVQGPAPQQKQPITCALSTDPTDMFNFFAALQMEQYCHDFQRNGVTSLHALCQITREQIEVIVTNEADLNVVLNELRRLVMHHKAQ